MSVILDLGPWTWTNHSLLLALGSVAFGASARATFAKVGDKEPKVLDVLAVVFDTIMSFVFLIAFLLAVTS